MEIFSTGLELGLLALPKHKETIRTFSGIVGYWDCLKEANKGEETFLFNALHDLRECCKNYLEPWFSPRLGRFAKIK